jgi:UDP-N-acetylmuramyl tripeptide synthase
VPIAAITGTNGKTTTARVLARIARKAGHVPGNTSTDGMSVDEHMIEAGDWTGPGAARTVLRHPSVDFGVLEVARGGILRRGLAIDCCDAAVVTNISPDHMGDYGIHDLHTMARVKAVVGSVVAASGRVILGADSPPLVELVRSGHSFAAPIVWFALRRDNPTIVAHRASGGEAWFVADDGTMIHARGEHEEPVVPVRELPFCFGGAAHYNVANGLAAAAAAHALGVPNAAIADGLRAFTSSSADNPGRANVARVGDVLVFLDFAHNPAGIRSLAPLLAALRGPNRLMVATGMAGDRRDEDIREAARAIHEMSPSEVRLRDLEHYLRGRQLGEVPAIMRKTLTDLGTAPAVIRDVETEIAVLREGLAWARPGDVVAILDHVERDEIQAELDRLGAVPYTTV